MSVRGAEFRKSDLQIHSPRDAGWEGSRPEDLLAVTPTKTIEQARYDYCDSLIKKCLQEGVRAIAITDHHEGVYAYIAIEAKKRLELLQDVDLWIYPGMELTFKDSCQGLLILDENLPRVLFEKVRSKLSLPADCKPDNGKGILVQLLNIDISELQSVLESDEELRNRFILLPHVKPGGHKTVMRQGFHKRFKDMPYVGGYMDRCYPHELNQGDQNILNGAIPDWSSDKRGVISTSDSRFEDFRLIGKHASWIKLASPTAESIRQAMLAPDSRIRHDEPRQPSVVISKMTIEGASYVENTEYLFNQQMNSVIGGRGAGKSSLLEYLRFGLGCSALDEKNETNLSAKSTERMREMLENTLDIATGKITIEVFLNGSVVEITRSMSNRQIIKISSNKIESVSTPAEVIKLVPIQPFRQGELSDLAREGMAARLMELVTASASIEISEVELKLKQNGQKLSETLAKAVQLTAAREQKMTLQTELNLLKSQIENLQKQVTGLSISNAGAITNHDKYLEEARNVEDTLNQLIRLKSDILREYTLGIELLAEQIKDRPRLPINELDSFYKTINNYFFIENNFPKLSDEITNTFDKIIENSKVLQMPLRVKFSEHSSAYDSEKAALIGHQDTLSRLESLNSRAAKITLEIEIAKLGMTTLENADIELIELRNHRAVLHNDLVKLTKQQIEAVESMSGGLARGSLSNRWDFSEAATAVRMALDIPQLREKRIESLLENIYNASNPLTQWEELVDELLKLVRWKEGSVLSSANAPETPQLTLALDAVFMEKLCTSIASDRVAGVIRAIIRPKVDIYQKRTDGEIEFRKASQGEQAATLLNILMSQSKGPLIIDQPEEDLDNKIINDIIKTIRKTKADRQLILSTHNANIVVNGDSELVLEMSLGKKKISGAIDEQPVRDAITSTIEGGKDAFELRRKKYNF